MATKKAVMKAATKKGAKKPVKKKLAKKRPATTKAVTITFTCDGECKASGEHVGRGAVILAAEGTNAFLWFQHDSPFKRGEDRIEVPKGQPKARAVRKDADDREYLYLLDCTEGGRGCRRTRGNPKMIVP